MMSLYDGMGLDNAESEKATGWSSSFTMLKSQLEAKKSALTKSKNGGKFRPTAPVIAPVINLNKANRPDDQIEFRSSNDRGTDRISTAIIVGESLDNFEDEYDPRYPNEYEKVLKKMRERRQREREEEKVEEMEDRRKRREARHTDRDRREKDEKKPPAGGIGSGFSRRPDSDDDEDDDDYEREKRIRMSAGNKVAIAPPTNLIEEDRKAEIPPPLALSGGAGTQFAHNLAGSVAHKIMSRYGFKEGQGLGKGNRGISHALQVEKTSKRGGKIISSAQIEKQFEEEKKREQEERENVANLLKNPTKVVCLRNMVGPGDVDDELEGETKEECGKYGDVRKCMIYEMVGQREEDEAVRIFVEFERPESAIKAVVDLNGRYFGGRMVRASFYNVNKFHDFLLGDPI